MNKTKKSAVEVIGSIVAIIILGVVFGLVISGLTEPAVSVTESGIKINGIYGLSVDFSEITRVTLIEDGINDIAGELTRTNGFGDMGESLKGHFESDKIGKTLLFVRTSSSPTLQIERNGSKDIYINFSNSGKTVKLYEDILLNMNI